ncbi:hypothetical protein LXA43DRAFT_1088109 [Ganoderma leucocontextum]|nr:hypothetical protein LXA43DRAFT_1088109 [Ganoderma leucocontextum]
MSANGISTDASIPSPTRTNISNAPLSLFSRRSPSSETGDFAHSIIPPSHPARTLVFCFHSGSGLGDKYDTRTSNVYKFFSLLNQNREDWDRQMCFYHLVSECDELHRPSQSCWETGGNLHKFVDKDCASGLDSDVFEGYHDLMTRYRAGDKVSLFGFSRGAYTARALAEMVHKVGLVPKYNAPWSPFAYTLYLREVDDDWHTSFAKFKEESNPINISIDFLGVWDTVSSVGDVIPCTLPFTKSNTSIRVFRQALALHERWAHLHPKFYEFDAQDMQDHTDVQEVWFSGSHCDIGGCAVPHDTPHSLGHIPLRWMVRECFKANTGIQFKAERLRDIGLDPASLYPIVKDRPSALQPRCHHLNTVAPRVPIASEEEHDVRDALSPMHDQLAVYAPLWWVMEFNPTRRHIPLGPPSEWKDGWEELSVRLKQPRGLFTPKHHFHFYAHPSVHIRKQAKRLREPKPF